VSGGTVVLSISALEAGVEGRQILFGVDLEVGPGEVHAIMGPNGSGKSTLVHVLMGRPGYELLGGRMTLDGLDLGSMAPWERAQAGLFLAMQDPIEVPGVSAQEVLEVSREELEREARLLDLDPRLLERGLNEDLSGGERKRSETLQMVMRAPKVALLDEIDSGLDADGRIAVARRIQELVRSRSMAVVAIVHRAELFENLIVDQVHVMENGRLVEHGGPELASKLEAGGYLRAARPK
jgi:Fe-S cluster assembly ATP-binding protein